MADNFKVPKLPGSFQRTTESSIKDSEETTSPNPTIESNGSNAEKPKEEEEETAQTGHVLDKSRDEPVALELSYNEPVWSGRPPSSSFFLSVIKNGVQVDSVGLNTPFVLFGRLPQCDVHLEHPSISRHHAVLQYRPTPSATPIESSSLSADPTGEAGFYLYDLGSTHGSYLNKNKVQPRKYYRVRVGQVMKFGGSTRIFVLDVSPSFRVFLHKSTCTLHCRYSVHVYCDIIFLLILFYNVHAHYIVHYIFLLILSLIFHCSFLPFDV